MKNSKLAYKRMGVLLCGCDGEIAKRINLAKVAEWLKKDDSAIIIKASDALCKNPNELSSFVEQYDITNVTIAACNGYKELFREASNKANLNPFHIKTVGLLEQTRTIPLGELAEEKAKILISAAICHQKQSSEISQENLKFVATPLDKKMDRRSFLISPFKLRAKVIPSITHSLCSVAQRCDLCINACPKQAITVQERKLRIIVSKCESCAICSVSCPRGAIFFPSYTLTQIDGEMRSLISANPGFLEPRILLFACSGGVSLLNELADNNLSYPANLMVIEVPCIGVVSPFIVLRAFDLGTAGLCLVPCQGKCQYGYDLGLLLENVWITAKLLEILGIGSERVCVIVPTEKDILKFCTELNTFVERVMEARFHPLCGKNPSELENLEGRLPHLLRQIVGKLDIDKDIRVDDSKMPFGILEVDAEKCSMCGLCVTRCPTNAISLKKETELIRLLFDYNLCIACDICMKRCPQKAMRIKRLLDLSRFEHPISILMENKTVKCQLCNTAFSPQRYIEAVSNRFPEKPNNYFQLISKYCPNCRVRVLLKDMTRKTT